MVLAALLATVSVGPVALLALVLAVGGVVLLERPVWALGIAVALPILIEPETDWGPSTVPARIYDVLPGAKITPLEVLVIFALVAALLDRRARREPARSLGVLSAPVALLVLGLLVGMVTGYDAGTGVSDLFISSRNALLVIVVPLIVVQVVGSRVPLRVALGVLLALAGVKGLAGMAALVTGQTAASSSGGDALTYYYAPTNALTMFALLFCFVCALRRLRLPAWAWGAVPFMALSLTFSYRRSFWVGTTLGVILVLLFALGQNARRVGIPAVVAVSTALFLSLGTGLGGGLLPAEGGSPSGLSGRLSSLNPQAVSQSKDDRYRIGERKNVLADLREAPLQGLGLGVNYRARYPLSIGSIPHDYVHVAALWWWMKGGILGLLGYATLMLVSVLAGARVFSRHPDPLVRAAGLAAACGMVGFAVAEATGTFVGPDPRAGVLIGAIVGLLAVADREAQQARPDAGLVARGAR